MAGLATTGDACWATSPRKRGVRAVDAAAPRRLPIDEAQQRPATGSAIALAGAVAGVEVRPARIGIAGAHAIFHVSVAGRGAFAPAGVGGPDRGGALARRFLHIGRRAEGIEGS